MITSGKDNNNVWMEQIHSLMERAISIILDRITSELPERGNFTPTSIGFAIPLTDNKCRIIVEPSARRAEEERRLRIGAHASGSDRMHSYYIFRGTNEEMKEYLMADDTIQALIQYCQQLSDAVDNDD